MVLDSAPKVDSPPGAGQHRRHQSWVSSRWRWLLGGLCLSWLLMVALYAAHLAVLVPPLVVLATASLVSGGRSLMDRIMIALALLGGVSCLSLVLFSFWPWGLHPVAVGGVALSVLAVAVAFSGRRPNLPQPRLADALVLGAGLGVALIVGRPLIRVGSFEGRLSIVASGEDFSRHLTVFDAAGQVGGYLFLHWDRSLAYVFDGMIAYPQASHVLSALVDGFVRSSGSVGTPQEMLDHYIVYDIGTYGLLAAAAVWATLWVAGARLSFARQVALAGIVSVVLLVGDVFIVIIQGYPAEAAGLVPMVLLVALAARPPSRQATLLIASLLVAVAFTYYVFLPIAGLIVGWWLLQHRQWRHHPYQFGIAVLAIVVSSAPPIIGQVRSDQVEALLVVSNTPKIQLLTGLTLVVLVGLGHAANRKSPRWCSLAASIAAVAFVTGAFLIYQMLSGAGPGAGLYYTSKLLHAGLLVVVVGLGSVVSYLPQQAPAPREIGWQQWRRTAERAVPGLVVTVALAAGTGLIVPDARGLSTTPVLAWSHRDNYVQPRIAHYVVHELNRPVAPGTTTIVIHERPGDAYLAQIFLAALQRTSGVLGPGTNGVALDDPQRYEIMAAAVTGPILLVTDGSAAAQAIAQAVEAKFPEKAITVARLDD